MVALAAAAMLGGPLALLHSGAAQRAATAHRTSQFGRTSTLGATQLISDAVRASPAELARHRSAVRHNLQVRRARARWHVLRVHAEAVAAHLQYVAALRRALAAGTPAPTAPTVVSRPTFARVGIATWYGWHPGQCASPFLPHGTLLTVTDLATGKTIQCLVTDTEAHNPGRVVDLSNWCFEELAPLALGVIEVRITW